MIGVLGDTNGPSVTVPTNGNITAELYQYAGVNAHFASDLVGHKGFGTRAQIESSSVGVEL